MGCEKIVCTCFNNRAKERKKESVWEKLRLQMVKQNRKWMLKYLGKTTKFY